ncbi:MAG TPA: hypothetical protein VGK31_12840 [Thermoanaerobaculia bacterium]
MRYAVASRKSALLIGRPDGGKTPVVCITTSVAVESTTTAIRPARMAPMRRRTRRGVPVFGIEVFLL